MLKSDYLSKRSEGFDVDQSSPALIMELLDVPIYPCLINFRQILNG
jgi:hypothetical protein